MFRCTQCRGKGIEKCPISECKGTGQIKCPECNGRHRVYRDGINYECNCDRGKVNCSHCNGAGKLHCEKCDGYGGFRRTPILQVEWCTRTCIQYLQNSFFITETN